MPDLADQVIAGDMRSLARAATIIENNQPGAAELLRSLSSKPGHALIVGVTGPPGAGKSTLVDQVIKVLRAQGKTVGVIAVDPSSPLTGGAVLGDRVRMQQHHADPGVFIRSMAARGAVGGLATATRNLVTLLDAAGRDVVIIETVGVGQSEVDVAGLAHVTVLVLAPGAGDQVQAMKAGVLEVATVFVVNKADLPDAEKLRQELHAAFEDRPIPMTVATEGRGIAELVQAIYDSPRKPIAARQHGISIDHLGIAVESVQEALNFYEKQLGLPVSLREIVAQEHVDAAMLPVGGPRIELLEATDDDSTIAKFIAKRGPGIHHIALRVPDLQQSVTRLKEGGARILNEPRTGAGGHLYVFIHPASTGGVLLELIQA